MVSIVHFFSARSLIIYLFLCSDIIGLCAFLTVILLDLTGGLLLALHMIISYIISKSQDLTLYFRLTKTQCEGLVDIEFM